MHLSNGFFKLGSVRVSYLPKAACKFIRNVPSDYAGKNWLTIGSTKEFPPHTEIITSLKEIPLPETIKRMQADRLRRSDSMTQMIMQHLRPKLYRRRRKREIQTRQQTQRTNPPKLSESKLTRLADLERYDLYNLTCRDLREMQLLFPTPRYTLHNMYRNLIMKYKIDANLLQSYELINTGEWICYYDLAWPEEVSIRSLGSTKQEAAHLAALSALHYLKRCQKIKIKVREPVWCFDDFEVKGMKKIVGNNNGHEYRPGLLSAVPDLRVYLNSKLGGMQLRSVSSTAYETGRSNMVRSKKDDPDVGVTFDKGTKVSHSPISAGTKLKENLDEEAIHPKEIEALHKLFPQPKNTLHNCFDIIAQELKRNDLKLTPQYKFNSLTKMWACIYHLKWPDDIKFSKCSMRKQDASHKTALSCLHWLRNNKKINASGQPLIYDSELVQTIKKSTSSVLCLSDEVESRLNFIYERYQTKLLKHLTTDFDEHVSKTIVGREEEFEKLWPEESKRTRKQKFKGLEVYLAKESTKLPISQYKQEIIDMIDNNRILIIKGEPGCGKSTRVPQYVLESWAKNKGCDEEPCRIVVTQPRRIAAISLAGRVVHERNETLGDIVGYQVRLKSSFDSSTGRILYCTTGILLRQIQTDPSLSDCTHVLLDEAHERDVNTDLLMNLLKHALDLNPNLRLVVMSATIDTNMFQKYFNNAPVIHIPGFTHPVEVHFVDESRKLDFSRTLKMCESGEPTVVYEDVVSLVKFIHKKRPEGAILCFLPGWEDITKVRKMLPNSSDLSVLCLHSKLQDSEQGKIFSRPPPGVRKVILATNIAETSVTIDDVVYVIDTGIQKENRLDVEKGVTCIDNHWISQSSMTQRKGRAGRVRPGESYHLYPKDKYDSFQKFSLPEILRTSLTKIVLDSKVYSNNMGAIDFLSQLPCPPETDAVMRAVEELKELELLDESENLTPLGRTLSNFQLEPKLSKAMVNAVIFKCVTPIVDIVTYFSSEHQIFATTLTDKEGIKKAKSEFSAESDHLSIMRIFEKWLEYTEDGNISMAKRFIYTNNLVDYKLNTLRQLREIHFEYLHKGLQSVLPLSDEFSDNNELVKAVLLSGVGTLLQHRNWDIVKGRMRKLNVLYTRHNQKATVASESVNFKRGNFPTDFLLYINETRSNIRRTTTIRETSLISPLAVLLFKNNKILLGEVSESDFSEKLASDDQVKLKLDGTKIEFICDRKQAEAIIKCRDALQAGYQYYIFQLTKGGEYDSKVNKYWREILGVLNQVLVNK